MSDILDKKFAVTENSVTDLPGEILVMLLDWRYWANNEGILDQWCTENGCSRRGMLIGLPDRKTLTLFTLRWI